MELALLGTGSCFPDVSRTPPCYHLSLGSARFIIDPGSGAISRLLTAGFDPYGADAIFITHHHLDHCADLLPILFGYKNCVEQKQKRDVRIFAPIGFRDVFTKLMDVYGRWIISGEYEIHIEEMGSGEYHAGGYTVKSKPMLHGANAIAYRFEKTGGKSLAYSGDTAYCEELIEIARGADLLLMECTHPDGVETDGHLRVSEAAKAAIASGVKRVVLTHLSPSQNPAAITAKFREMGYAGELIVGEDGMRVEV